MPCGLCGKLPMKRDFISVSTPQAFLRAMGAVDTRWHRGEPHRSGCTDGRISSCARRSGDSGWARKSAAARLMGSFMPSVDGVGRFLLSTAFACGEAGSTFPTPKNDPQAAWFAEVEAMLLDALDEDTAYDRVLATLKNLPAPASPRHSRSRGGHSRSLFRHLGNGRLGRTHSTQLSPACLRRGSGVSRPLAAFSGRSAERISRPLPCSARACRIRMS